jgi:hypothetical protein
VDGAVAALEAGLRRAVDGGGGGGAAVKKDGDVLGADAAPHDAGSAWRREALQAATKARRAAVGGAKGD